MADFNPTTTEPPLGLTNPLLPPEPLGQEPLYPQFLMPVAAESLMAVNPFMFFPEGIPGYQLPENPFQESPFFTEARASLRTGQAEVLPELLQGSRRVPRPILSDLLGDLEFQTDSETPAESLETTTDEIETEEVLTLEEEFEVTEEQEIQPVLPEEAGAVELPTIPEVEGKEFVETVFETELSPLSPEVSSNPLSVSAVSEENYDADTSPSEPIAAALPLQETGLIEPTVAFSSASEEVASPVVSQSEESPEETEVAVVPEHPEIIEQPSDVGGTVSPEAELSEETEIPEPITTNSFAPEFAETLIESTAENITPGPELSPVTPTTASSVISDLEPTAPEPEEVSETSELVAVQNEPEAVGALEATTAELENTEPIEEVEAAVSPESELPEESSLPPVAESAAKAIESLPELTNEAPVLSTEEVAAEIVEPPISNPEIIAAEIEEPVGSVAEPTPLLAEAELTSLAEPETPPSMAVSAEIELAEEPKNSEQLPSNEESIAVPVEVIPEGEPLAAEQNRLEEAVAAIAEPLAVTPEAMVAPEAEQNPENQSETEFSPPISRIQELVEQQIEAFSGLEQEEVIEEEASIAPESTVPPAIQEGTQPPAVEENIPGEILPEVATTEMAAPSLAIPIATESESAPPQNNVELPVAQTEANVEAVLSLPTILNNLGILTPLITSSPLTQLANFLPVTEPFAAERREGISLGLEQPMIFASPPITSSPLTQLTHFLSVTEPFTSEQGEGIPLGLEQPMTFASITPPPSEESNSSTTPNFLGSNEESNLSLISETNSSTTNSSTETESSISQEGILSFSEAMSSLPVVSTLPVMRNEGIFTPLTFMQKSINNPPINEQERSYPHSLPALNIPQEWSSIEEFINSNLSIERDESSSLFSPAIPIISNEPEGEVYTPEISNFVPSRSLMGGKEQNFLSESTSLDNIDESLLNLPGEENSFPDEVNQDKGNEIDLEVLAQEIYGRLRQRLVIERERQGFYSGRLPW
ncbi:MAG: hypothetical protein WCA07_14495 [Gloeobacterales cyanobacterium]